MYKTFTQPLPMLPSTHDGYLRLTPSLFTRRLKSFAGFFFFACLLLVGYAHAQNGPSCSTFTNKTTTNGLGNNSVYGVYVVGTTVYAGTNGGLSISTDGGATFTNRTTTNGLGNNVVFGVYAVGTTVYAATGGGLSISTDGGATFTNKTTTNGLGDNVVRGVFAVGTTVYAATDFGLSISTDGGATFTNKTATSGLGSSNLFGVYAVGTTVYAATGNGLSISTDGGATFTNRTTTNGLGNNIVRGVYAVGSTVYAATDGGLSISTDGGATFTSRTTTNGLGSNTVRGVYAVSTTVYAATSGGLSNCSTTTLAIGTAISPTNCTTPNGSIAFTSTGFAAGNQTLNYSKDGTPTSATVNVANGTFTLTGLGAGAYTAFAIGATTATGTNPTLAPPALPTITLGTIAGVSTTATSFSIPYTATTGSPDQYSLVASPLTSMTTPMPNFTAVNNVGFSGTSGTFNITIPTSAAGTYNFNLTVSNSTTGCVSAVIPVALTVTAAATPAGINIKGNGNSITAGSTTATASNYTDFGSVKLASGTQTYNFMIQNTGNQPLDLSGTPIVSITGANAADFTVISQPASATVAGLSTTNFEIRFDPSAAGLRTATVNIASNGSNNTNYTFAISGTGDATPILEQYPYMVADIASGLDLSPSSNPENITVVGSKVYFKAGYPTALWVSDGTAAGTTKITGSDMYSIDNLTNVNGTLYFSASTNASGTELYKHDGTSTTATLIDINAGSGTSNPFGLTNVNGILYFGANDGTNGRELFKYDGTTPTLIDINVGTGDSNPYGMFNINGTFYFGATTTANGTELYKYSGTGTTATLIDINPAAGSSNPNNLTNVNGTLYFTATGANGTELYKYDGTNFTLIDIHPSGSSFPSNLINVNNTLYFKATNGTNGVELFKYDGTSLTLFDIHPTGHSGPSNLTNVNNTLYFTATNGTNGTELYKYTGTGSTATLIDINPSGDSNPSNFTNVNGTLYFSATNGVDGNELFKYDGSNLTLIDINSGTGNSYPGSLINVNNTLYFRASTSNTGSELYKYDGTNFTVIDVRAGSEGSNPSSLTNVNGTLYFVANNGINGTELWKSNGTQAGTQLVKDIGLSISSSFPNDFIDVGGTLYFAAQTSATGNELFKSDGNTVSLAADIQAGSVGSNPANLINVAGTLYFTANGTNGNELYKYNGTTATLIDINVGANSSSPQLLTNVNGVLYFKATTNTTGYELYKYDGNNLTLVDDITPGTNGSNPDNFTNINGTLYFTAYKPTIGKELFKYDGNTLTPIDVLEGINNSSYPENLVDVNGVLHFVANMATGQGLYKYDGTLTLLTSNTSNILNLTNANGVLYFRKNINFSTSELYKYDGNAITLIELPAGSTLSDKFVNVNGTLYFTCDQNNNRGKLFKYTGSTLTEIDANIDNFESTRFANINGTLYFAAGKENGIIGNSSIGAELYKYDGTTLTPFDINPEPTSSSPSNFSNINGTLYFRADNGTNGEELWKSDGTVAGTKMIKDIQPGTPDSYPINITLFNNKPFFSVAYTPTDSTYGTELWTLGNCTPTNVAVTSAGTNVSFNTEQQASPTTQSCHCDVFNKLITTINANGASPISGEVSSKVWIDASATANYVQRHYEITPANNPSTATGKVTLYFTQAEFDAFNALSNSDLPSNGSDATGKANLLIKRYNGTSSNGTGAENTYTGTATIIDPTDTDIVWNAIANRWEVSFDAVGFGGYFVITGSTPTITNIPASACVGSSITITGTNFTGATAVSIGGVAVTSFVVNSATQITATVATGNTGTISVTTPNGTAVSSSSFTAYSKPSIPTISGSTEICEGTGTTLTASSLIGASYTSITYNWTGGQTGYSFVASPTSTRTYRVAATANGCTSDSSAVFTLTVNPKPATPSIIANNMTICKGGNAILTGSCSTAGASFRWTTPPFNSGNQTSALPSTNQRSITEPGTYKGLCESNKGCLSAEVSITITQASDCSGQNFITITPERPAICPGQSIIMTATGCAGTLTWLGGTSTPTGASVTLNPATTTTYLVNCSTGGSTTGSTSFDLVVASNTLTVLDNVSTDKRRFKAETTLTSDKKVGNENFTPGANVIYEAGNSITLLPGFTAEKWSVFRAEIKTCPQQN